VWADDSQYDGYYKGGMKEGKGKFTWKDGSSYMGDFHQNNLHGQGLYLWGEDR